MFGFFSYLLVFLAAIALFFAVYILLKSKDKADKPMSSDENVNFQFMRMNSQLESDLIQSRNEVKDLKSIIDSMSDIVFELDMEGKILFLNAAWEKITNIDPWTIMESSLFDLLSVSDTSNDVLMFEQFVAGKKRAYRYESRLRMNDGGSKPIELTFNVIRIANDKSVRVVGTMSDIEERVRVQSALRETESRYTMMVEKSLGGFYEVSVDGKLKNANPALAKMLGYETPEDLLSNVKDVSKNLYIDKAAHLRILEEADSKDGVQDIESLVYRKDGEKIWVMETIRPIKDGAKIVGYEGTMSDISRRKKMETDLIEAKKASDVANRAKSEFLANMSHELRTPLNSIIGFSEILKDEIFGDIGRPEYKEYSQDIHMAGTHLLSVINDILDVSKIEAGKRELNESSVDLKFVADAAIKLAKPKASSSKIIIQNDIPKTIPRLRAEELAMKQILINLLNNAIKFSKDESKIIVSAGVYEDEFVLSVSDSGIGMRTEDIEKALAPFGQIETELSKEVSGTGLGLTLVQQLTELHDGRLFIESVPNKGTTVRVHLPKERILK